MNEQIHQTIKKNYSHENDLSISFSLLQKNGEIFEENLIKDIDNLIQTLENKKQELLTYIHKEIERKISLIHQQYASYNAHIQRTTGFLQFSIEALKESDPYAYIQVCHFIFNDLQTILEI